jgi:ABC-type spermidine/putrescine transport system permease subunit II
MKGSRWRGARMRERPGRVFGQVKREVTPETNAVATMMLFVTLALLFVGQLALARGARRTGGVQEGGMAGMIAQQR